MKFEIKDIPLDIQNKMIEKKVWTSECIISLTKLKLLTLSHYNFDSRIEIGQMVALGSMADSVIAIFQELFALKFPIHTIKLIDEFEGDDELSMSANNSSCFNFRKIAGTDKLSLHEYGLAIDINPMQNPFIQNGKILPANGKDFIDRSKIKAGMVEPVVEVFYKYGFTEWGGNWQEPIDYHHFQVPRQQIEALLAQCN
jgi:hypothetical protein